MAIFKMTSCSNSLSAGMQEVGRRSGFEYDGNRFFFGSIQSSAVKSIVHTGKDLTVQTKNTQYTFKESSIDDNT